MRLLPLYVRKWELSGWRDSLSRITALHVPRDCTNGILLHLMALRTLSLWLRSSLSFHLSATKVYRNYVNEGTPYTYTPKGFGDFNIPFNDPLLSDQWHYINNCDLSVAETSVVGADINVKDADIEEIIRRLYVEGGDMDETTVSNL